MMSKCIEVYEGFRTSVYQILDHVAGQNYIAFIDQIAREFSIIPVFRGFIFAAVVCEVSLTAGRELWVVTVVDVSPDSLSKASSFKHFVPVVASSFTLPTGKMPCLVCICSDTLKIKI